MPSGPQKTVKMKSPKPPGSRTEQHAKSRLKADFGGMSDLMSPQGKLSNSKKPRLR